MSTNPVKEKNHFAFVMGAAEKAKELANGDAVLENEIKADALNNPPATENGVEAQTKGFEMYNQHMAKIGKKTVPTDGSAPVEQTAPDTSNASLEASGEVAAASDVEPAKTSQQLTPQMVSALMGVVVQLARAEGITGEDETVNRANEIFNDASLDEPQTDAGKSAKTMAMVALTQAQPAGSPNMAPVKFDYDGLRDQTSIPACGDLIAKMGELAPHLPIPQKPTPEQEAASEKAYNELALATFDIFDKRNIGMAEYKFIFDSAKACISALEDYVMQQVVGHRHEITSRIFGAKNPGTGKFDANYATYGDLKKSLEEARKATGGKLSDYFNHKDEEPTAPEAPAVPGVETGAPVDAPETVSEAK